MNVEMHASLQMRTFIFSEKFLFLIKKLPPAFFLQDKYNEYNLENIKSKRLFLITKIHKSLMYN